MRPAATVCRLPNSTLEAVSLPVSATPSQPNRGEKKGNKTPLCAKRQSHRRIDAAVARGQSEGQHGRDGQERRAHAVERSSVNPDEVDGRDPEAKSPNDPRKEQGGSRRRQRRELEDGLFRFRSRHHRRHADDVFVEIGDWNFRVPIRSSSVFTAGRPQRKTNTHNRTHGIQATSESRREGCETTTGSLVGELPGRSRLPEP